ncbi:MAG: PHP domain-containing protein, partial [Candidatus Competibacteraceae bacterium]|nr:PHP domain-containing protein [Candidatus Competibacteraceae bacterium]
MLGDLHVHTRYSDGSYTVAEALSLARERRLDYIGIVDHDTTAGIAEALRLAPEYDLIVVPGIEISAFDSKRNRKVHLLGYGLHPGSPAVNELCTPLLSARHENTLWQIDQLVAAGYAISRDEVEAVAAPAAVLYKQHVMQVLVNKGYTDAIYSPLYARLFRNGGLCARDIAYVDVFAALEAILADGGIPVLAHPGQLDSYEVLEELIASGLKGVELYHADHSVADHKRVLGVLHRHPDLIATGGSDDHGEFGSSCRLGDIRAPHAAQRVMQGGREPLIQFA